MCYYNGQKVSREQFIRLLKLERPVRNYNFLDKGVINGFSDTPLSVLRPNDDKSNFDIVQMEWGFLPPYLKNREAVDKFRTGYKDEAGQWHIGYTTQNAKVENLFVNEKGNTSLYADAARKRRCLVLSTGFYEWRHVFPLNKKTGQPLKTSIKYPYYISLKEHEYFYMLAVYQEWVDKDTGEAVDTVSIITTEANSLMSQVHNSKKRMPSIPTDELAYEWLFGDLSEDIITEIAKAQYPASEMDACTITKEFQALLDPTEPFSYADLPALDLSFV